MIKKTTFRAGAAFLVAGMVAFSIALACHVFFRPLGGLFERIVPINERMAGDRSSQKLVAVLASNDLPVIDPADQFHDEARRLMSAGKHAEAREKLGLIIENHPLSARAELARDLLGEMNLDGLFCAARLDGKVFHYMQRGETFEKVAKDCRTNLDCLLYLNPFANLQSGKEGDRLLVLPLDFHFVLEIERKVISVWNGSSYLCEFKLLQLVDRMLRQRGKYVVESKAAGGYGDAPAVGTSGYRMAPKAIWLAQPTLKIQGWDGEGDPPEGAVLLADADMEELFLLTRPGNQVEIR